MELKYSIDKVKLYLHGIKIDYIRELMNDLLMDMKVTSYESKSLKACRYNYIISEEDTVVFDIKIKGNTFYLGIEPNWSKDKNKRFRDIVIEYNPNKIVLSKFRVIDCIMPISEYKTEIMSIDVAIDLFGYSMNDLIIYKRHGNEFFSKIGHSQIETHYLGAFGESGHIKVYDKAKEQKVIDDEKWTRYEITYKKLGFIDIRDTEIIDNTKLADVRIIDKDIDVTGIKDTERYILLTSMEHMELINTLGRYMKIKILDYHKKLLKPIDINKDEIIRVYKEFNII